jgi:hypothetical protein
MLCATFLAASWGLTCQLKTPAGLLDNVLGSEITAFSIGGVPGVINGNSIYVELRWTGVNHRSAIATFSDVGGKVTVDGIVQVSGVTVNDFAMAKTYVVKGFDGVTHTYTVTTQGGYPIADTGQTLCSSGAAGDGAMATCPQTIVGQDGNHADKPAARSFTGPTQHAIYTNDYTTTDNVTGLVWRSCSEGFTGPPPACTPGAAGNYTLSPDTTTCAALNSANAGAGYAGRQNWRLANIEELSTLTNKDGASPAIDTAHFPATVGGGYWSSSTYESAPTNAWNVFFSDGSVAFSLKTGGLRVRCVSSSANTYKPIRVDNGDGTITDVTNNLVWQKCSRGFANDAVCSGAASSANWTAALAYCEGLSLASRIWRLPNINELGSLVNSSATIGPMINTSVFPASVNGFYFSSSTRSATTANAWGVSFINGTVGFNAKANSYFVRCVATGP